MKKKPFWLAIPSWLILGSLAILVPLFTILTIESINAQRELTTRLMFEKGDALIRSFEAGARTGIGMQWGSFQIQKLLIDTAQQPGVDYLVITDLNGKILADSDPSMVGEEYGDGQEIPGRAGQALSRQITGPDGNEVFEIYHFFSFSDSEEPDSVIYLGLDMDPVISARNKEIMRTVLVSAVLLVLGIAGILLLQIFQAYRTARTSLARAEALSDTLVRNMPVGLIALDREGTILTVNEAAQAILNMDKTALEGRPSAGLLPGALEEAVAALRPEAGGGREKFEAERECDLAGRVRVPLEITAVLLRDESGERLGYLAAFRDLTEIRQLREEIARSQRLASLGSLAAGVAHEIRNPLSSIKGFATYFRERYRDVPEDSGTAQIMIEEVDRLNRVISQLLELSRPSGLKLENLDMAGIVRRVLALTAGQAQEKGIRIETDLPREPLVVRVDPDKMEQALLNVLLNAVQANDENGSIRVEGRGEQDGGRIRISITDSGRGIKSEDLPRIFDPYFTTRPSGTGLGLAIAHKIIEAHHGEIRASSPVRDGRGTEIQIFIPAEEET